MSPGMRFCGWALVLVLAGAAGEALAQARCDCSQKLGKCDARVKLQQKQLLVSSSSPQCSMVVFFADGQPHVSTVTDGISSEPWLGPTAEPKLQVESCTVCADRNAPVASAPAPAPAPVASPFLGAWTLHNRCSWGSSTDSFSIDEVAGGKLTASGRFGNCSFDEGRVSGTAIVFSCSNWLNTVRYSGELLSPLRMAGTYTQSTSSESCDWEAIKQ